MACRSLRFIHKLSHADVALVHSGHGFAIFLFGHPTDIWCGRPSRGYQHRGRCASTRHSGTGSRGGHPHAATAPARAQLSVRGASAGSVVLTVPCAVRALWRWSAGGLVPPCGCPWAGGAPASSGAATLSDRYYMDVRLCLCIHDVVSTMMWYPPVFTDTHT